MLAPQKLKPSPKNPRLIPASAVEVVSESIRRFGFRQPIVVDEDMEIIIGHVRHQASLSLELDEVPVHVAIGMSDDEVHALRLVDNRTAEMTNWDETLLDQELASLITRADERDDELSAIANRPLDNLGNLFEPEVRKEREVALKITFGVVEAPWKDREKKWFETMTENYGDGLRDELIRRVNSENRTAPDGSAKTV